MKIKGGEKGGKRSQKSSSSEEEEPRRKSMGEIEGVQKPKAKDGATTFSTYIYRVKKQVHPDLGISKSSMKVIESFINDFFQRICSESSTLMTSSGTKTLRSQDVLAAITMVLPGELGKHAHGEAQKAIDLFKASG